MKQKADPVIARVQGEVELTLDSYGYELVQLRLGGRVGSQTLTVLMDKPGGVTVADCQLIAARLSVLLDALDPIAGHYTLMVSSPGVNRPLTKDADFERFVGERITLRAGGPGERARTRHGKLLGVQDGVVRLAVGDEELGVPLADIEAANLQYDWDQENAVKPGT